MKIKKLKIYDYNQFRDFELDLTYPKGHKKAGQPLDKICFIGQNGTGKTTLLNIINELVRNNNYHNDAAKENNGGIFYNDSKKITEILTYCPFAENYDKITFKIILNKIEHFFTSLEDYDSMRWHMSRTDFEDYYQKQKIILINFPLDNKSYLLPNKNNNQTEYIKTAQEIEKISETEKKRLSEKKIFDFKEDNINDIWRITLADNTEYLIDKRNFNNKIAEDLLKTNAQMDKIVEEVKKWNLENPNPMEKIAHKINPILQNFNLKIKTDINLKNVEDLYFIQIQSTNEKDVPYQGWSSGTRQLIMTAIPLIQLDTWQSIILIDEPENSLYPDTQYKIIDFYSQLAPDAQIFFATHSPIIAAAFEPWEIVELKFEEDKITQESYYNGERHIDNYFLNPQLMRWDSILNRLFDIVNDGAPQRKNEIWKLAELGTKIKYLKTQANTSDEDLKILWTEYKKIAEKLDWKIDQK